MDFYSTENLNNFRSSNPRILIRNRIRIDLKC